MRYIFTEVGEYQSVYDIDTAIWYKAIVDLDNYLKVIVESVDAVRYSGLVNNRAISFWEQLAVQVDQRCAIKDVKEKMLAFIDEVDDDQYEITTNNLWSW